MSTPPLSPAPTVNIARAIRGALLQAETKRWMVSRGKRKGQNDSATSSPTSKSIASPGPPGLDHYRGGSAHIGLVHSAVAEAELAALLGVFEVRDAETKEHGHATTEVPSADIAALLESIGVSCSSGELEALCEQLQHIAGRISARDISTLIIDTASRIILQRPQLKRSTNIASSSSSPQAKSSPLNRHAAVNGTPLQETSTPKSPSTPMSKGGGEANKDALPATPLPSDATAYPSIDVQLLAMGVRRQQMLNHIMDGSDKGPERRAKVTLSAPLDTPTPPPLSSASEIALAEVIRDVMKRAEHSSGLQKSANGSAKATMSLYRVPSATERRD